MKTAPPETLTLKVKSSKEGEYSILDKDDIPAKAEVQDAGFLPDPSAEKQKKIDKVKKENRDIDTTPDAAGTRRVELNYVSVQKSASGNPILQTEIGGAPSQETLFLNKIIIRDNREQLTRGLDQGDIVLRKWNKNDKRFTELCRMSGAFKNQAVQVVEWTNDKASVIAIDASKCNRDDANTKKKFVDFWTGYGDIVDVQLGATPNSTANDFDVYFWANPTKGKSAGEVSYPSNTPEGGSWTKDYADGKLTTETTPVDGSRTDVHVKMERTFVDGAILDDEATVQVQHLNGFYLDNEVSTPVLKVLDANGNEIKKLEGKAQDVYPITTDVENSDYWGGLTFTGLKSVEGPKGGKIEVPKGGKIVVEMGFRKKATAPVDDESQLTPLGPGALAVNYSSPNNTFELVDNKDISASTTTVSRKNPFEDKIIFNSRAHFEGAEVTVNAPNSILGEENYTFEIKSDPMGKTGLEAGYTLGKQLVSATPDAVTYKVFPVKDRKKVDSALIEKGTEIVVRSKFSSVPEKSETVVELKGKDVPTTKSGDWSYGAGATELFPMGGFTVANGDIFRNSAGPFRIEDKDGVVMYGGLCVEPDLGYPGGSPSKDPKDWYQYPVDRSPVDGSRSIDLEHQRAVSYIVNSLAYKSTDKDEARRVIRENAKSIAQEAGIQNLNHDQAFEAAYVAALKLVGYTTDDLESKYAKNPHPLNIKARNLRYEIYGRADKIVNYLLNVKDLKDEPVNYQMLKYKHKVDNGYGNITEVQTILIPGPGDEGSSAMSTTATLEKGNFGEQRVNRSKLNYVDMAYDRVDYRGLGHRDYELKTELHRVADDGKSSADVVWQDIKTVTASGTGSWNIEVDLKKLRDEDKLKPGRYVFYETVVRDGTAEVVWHREISDLGQSFWIDEPDAPKPGKGRLEITKVSVDGDKPDDYKPVKGAAFEVRREGHEPIVMQSEDDMTFKAEKLDLDTEYTLVEVQAPSRNPGENYQLLPEPLKFRIDSDPEKGLQFWSNEKGTYVNGQNFPVVKTHSDVAKEDKAIVGTATVANVWIGDMPKTGGNGIAPWLLLGGLIMAAGALMGNRRRA
ncbi:hypothetical protein HMPREF3149_11275 [Corynebacterium sp. HMSC05E07]|nr:hypothetical protein HMPREF3149_11275 [Corynebacterium sp. HMSC05E07]